MGEQVEGQAQPPRPRRPRGRRRSSPSTSTTAAGRPSAGRDARFPSYFLKPPSTLSTDGAVVERPMGCELLAFEGEIALVIGRTTRRIDAGDAWGHVAHVAAANDLGVYDLRYADRGRTSAPRAGTAARRSAR